MTTRETLDKARWKGTDSTFEGWIVARYRKLSGKPMVVLEDERGLNHIYPDDPKRLTIIARASSGGDERPTVRPTVWPIPIEPDDAGAVNVAPGGDPIDLMQPQHMRAALRIARAHIAELERKLAASNAAHDRQIDATTDYVEALRAAEAALADLREQVGKAVDLLDGKPSSINAMDAIRKARALLTDPPPKARGDEPAPAPSPDKALVEASNPAQLEALLNSEGDAEIRIRADGSIVEIDKEVEAVGWAILQSLHTDVPDALRPQSWSDLSGDHEQRVRAAAVAAIECLRNLERAAGIQAGMGSLDAALAAARKGDQT